jgi:xylose isomerase-like TIM barrel protein
VLSGRPIGIVDVALAPRPLPEAATLARRLGFTHIDVPDTWDGELELRVGDRMAFPSPRPNCSTPAPPEGDGVWERARAAYRRTPGMRVEPWGGSILNSIEKIRAMLSEVPGLRLLVDTGHVAGWGEDPVELLDAAGHVQLRQAKRGQIQCEVDDGDIDFRRVFERLDQLDYRGLVSVEYFDLPDRGWPLDDPLRHAVALAEHLRSLMKAR